MNRLVVIGDPIEHSLSPIMQNAALRELGLDREFVFEKTRVKEEELKNFIKKVKQVKLVKPENIVGLNVTIPHKVAITKLLDELSEEAELIGAVNTIKKEGRKLIGFNTDGIGCINALKEKGFEIKNKKAVLLGAGGAARAIAFVLAQNGLRHLVIMNRTSEKAEELAKEVSTKTKARVTAANLANLSKALSDSDVLINATAVGMNRDETLVTAELMQPNLVVFDIVYSPLKTKLLKEAEKAGAKIIDGLEMLVQQGAVAFELFTGKKAPVEAMRNALRGKLKLQMEAI